MKRAIAFCAGIILFSFMISCSGEKKSGAGKPRIIANGDTAKETTIWYDSEIGTRQKSYKKELQGNWNITVMHRQQKAIPEKLDGVVIGFAPDSSFTGRGPCNSINGIYILKGTSIRFSGIVSTKMSCPAIDTETAFLKLLEQTVSAYSVSDKKLLLRDGSANIVFECEKK